MRRFGLACVALLVVAGVAGAVTLSNGYATSDSRHYSIDVDVNGYSTSAYINAPGYGLENLMYEYIPYLQGNGLHSRLTGGVWDDSDPSDNIIRSHGTTVGINWSLRQKMEFVDNPGTTNDFWTVRSSYTFTNPTGGVLPTDARFFKYLDEDVYSISYNILVVTGPIAGSGISLLTVRPDYHAGVASAGDYRFTGWAAMPFASLRSTLESTMFDAAATGTVSGLAYNTVPLYGYSPYYGPADITTAIEYEMPDAVLSYSFDTFLGGLPTAGDPPPPPPPPPPPDRIPEPATMGLMLTGLAGLLARRVRRAVK